MRMRPVPAAALAVLFLLIGPGIAAAEGPAPLRWSDIVDLVDAHPLLGAARGSVTAAEAAVRQARQVPNPELDVTAGHGLARAGGVGRFEWGLALSVPLDWLNGRGARLDLAGTELDIAAAEVVALRRQVLGELRTRFWRALYSERALASLAESDAQARELLRLVGQRVEKGEARPIERVRVEVDVQRVSDALARAEIDARASRAELATWIGVTDPDALTIAGDLDAVPELPELATLRARVLAEHPDTRVATARVRARETAVEVERSARLPRFGVAAFYDDELDRRAYGGVVTVELPLWNWNDGGIARAEAEAAVETERLAALRRDLDTQVVAAHARLARDRQTAIRYRGELLPRAEETVRTLERTFALGETDLIEVLDARRILLAARQDYVAALLEMHTDESALATLTGGIDE